jgi:hypothetical protein
MELDDLKKDWNKIETTKIKNMQIMDLVHQKNYGPLAAIKKGLRKQIILMSIMPLVLITTNITNLEGVFTSILFWSYVAFCILVILFSLNNYAIVKKMEARDGNVKSTLEEQLSLLEQRQRMKLNGLKGVMLFFIVLLEVVPFIQDYRMLNKWHALNPLIRFGAYAGFLVLQHFVARQVSHRRFGKHLEYLRGLVREMQ